MGKKLLSILLTICLCASLAGGLVSNIFAVSSMASGDIGLGKVATASSNLTVRSGPGTNYSSIRSLPKGYVLEIITPDYIQGWHKVKYSYRTGGVNYRNEVGYCSADYIDILQTDAKLVKLVYEQDDYCVNVRSSAGGGTITEYASGAYMEWDGTKSGRYYKVYNAYTQAWNYVHDSVAVQYDTGTGVVYPSAAAGIEEGTIYNIQNAASGLYMYTSGTSNSSVIQNSVQQTGNYRWKFVLTDGGYYKIVSALNNNMVLAVQSSGEGNQNLIITSDSDSANKRWNIIKQGNYYIFRSKSSDRTYSAASQNNSAGSTLVQRANASSNTQYWTIQEPSLSPPVISIAPESITNQNVTVTITYPSGAETKQYSIDNGAWQTYTAPFTVEVNSTVSARYYDAQGLISPSASYDISNIDKTPPAAPVISAISGEGNVSVSISYPTDAAVKQYRLDNGAWQDYSQPFTLSQSGTIEARCYDQAGNVSEIDTYEVSLPPAAPTFTSQPDSSVPSASYTVTINYPDGAVVKQYRIGEDGQWLDYTGSLVITQSITIYAKCYNAAGEVSSTSEYQVVIQEVPEFSPPEISADPSVEEVTDGPVTITIVIPEEADGAQYRVDSGEWQNYIQPFGVSVNSLIEARSMFGGAYSSIVSYEVKNITSFEQPPAVSAPVENPETGSMLYIMQAGILYELPDVESDSVTSLPLNTQVKLYEYDVDDSGWSIVKNPEGYVGYVSNSSLSAVQTVSSLFKDMDYLKIWSPYEQDAYHMSIDGTGTVQNIPAATAETAYILYVMQTEDGVKYVAVPDVTDITVSSRPVGWVSGDYTRVYRNSQTASESYYSREFPVKYVNAAGMFLTPVSQSTTNPEVNGMSLSFNEEVTVLFTAEDIGQAVVMTSDGYVGWLDTDSLSNQREDVQEETVFLTMQVTYPDGLNLRSGPSTNYDLIAEIPLYGLIEIIEEGINTPWSLVRVKSDDQDINGLIGYCSLNLTQHFAGSETISEDLWVTMYTTEDVNLLKQPYANADSLSSLDNAVAVTVAVGASLGDYYFVKTSDGAYGYIDSQSLTFTEPEDPGPAEYKTNKDNVILYVTEGNITAYVYLPAGLYVNVVWETDTRYGVYIPGDNQYSGQAGFINKTDLDLVNYNRFEEWQDTYQTYYIQAETPFRIVPDAHSHYNCALEVNDTVTVIQLNYDSQWSLVYTDIDGFDCLGYVYTQFLGIQEAEVAPSPTIIDINQSVDLIGNYFNETPVLVTLTPDNIQSLEVLKEIYLLNTGKYWYAVRVISNDASLNNMVGFVFKQEGPYFTVSQGDDAWYNLNNQNMFSSGDSVRIRKKPDTSDNTNIIITVDKGDAIQVVYKNYNDEWSIVCNNFYIGYMYNDYISEVRENDSEYIKTMKVDNAVNLRTGPSANYEYIMEIPAGAQVNIIDMDNPLWYHVEYQGNIGYCSSNFLSDIGGSGSGSGSSGELPEGFEDAMFLKHDDYYAQGAVRYTYVANDVMNFRDAPNSTTSNVIATLANDTAVTILEQTDYEDSFVKVRVNSTGQEGYIYKLSLYVRPLAGHSSDNGKIMSNHVFQDGYEEVLKEMADALGTHYLVLAGILQRECSGIPMYSDNGLPLIRIEGRKLIEAFGDEAWEYFIAKGYYVKAFYRSGGSKRVDTISEINIEKKKDVKLWDVMKGTGSDGDPNINAASGTERYTCLYAFAEAAESVPSSVTIPGLKNKASTPATRRELMFNCASYGCMQLMGDSARGYNVAYSGESVLDRMSTGNVEQLEFLFRFLDNKFLNESSSGAQALATLKNNPFNENALIIIGDLYNGSEEYGRNLLGTIKTIQDENDKS